MPYSKEYKELTMTVFGKCVFQRTLHLGMSCQLVRNSEESSVNRLNNLLLIVDFV